MRFLRSRVRFFSSPSSVRVALGLAGCLALAAPASSSGAPATEPARKQLSTKTTDSLDKLRALTEGKDHAAAFALTNQLLSAAAPASFDTYILSQIQAQILLAQNRLSEAIAPLETALRLGEGNVAFLDPAARLEQLNLLAQLHYQRAEGLSDAAARRAGYEQSLTLIRRWFEHSPRPTLDSRLFAASLLYQIATIDPAKPDLPRIRDSLAEAREARLLASVPSAPLTTLLVAAHLQLGENVRAAEFLEAQVERDPKNASAWSQLQSIYLASAAEAKDPDEARRLNLRALLVLERAQAAGLLDSPKEHYTRAAVLFNLGQFTRAAGLLEKGLGDATLESTRRNWELLASAYSQLGRDDRALDALDRAVGRFPADAALEFSLAQSLYEQGRLADAYARAESAVLKPGLEKPGQARVYLAYLAFELQRYADADRWVAAARAGGDVPDATLDPLARAVAEALRERRT